MMATTQDIQNAINAGTCYMMNLWKPSISMFGEYPGLPFWISFGDDYIQLGSEYAKVMDVWHPDLPDVSFYLSLKEGWNLISLPVMPYDNSVDVIFYNVPIIKESVTKWDSMRQQYQCAITQLFPFEGYWIYAAQDTNVNIVGKPVSTEYYLNSGWNLVGSDVFEPLQVGNYSDTDIQRIIKIEDESGVIISKGMIAYIWNINTKSFNEVTEIPVGYGGWLYVEGLDCRYVPVGDRFYYHFKKGLLEYDQWVRYYPIALMNCTITPIKFNAGGTSPSMYLANDLIWSNSPELFVTKKTREYLGLPSTEYGVRHVALMTSKLFRESYPNITNAIDAKLTEWEFGSYPWFDIYNPLFGIPLPTKYSNSRIWVGGGGTINELTQDEFLTYWLYHKDCYSTFPTLNDYHPHQSGVCGLESAYFLIAGIDPLHWCLTAMNLYLHHGYTNPIIAIVINQLINQCEWDGKGVKGGWINLSWDLTGVETYSTVRLAVYMAANAMIGNMERAQECADILLQLQWNNEYLVDINGSPQLYRNTAHNGGFFVGYRVLEDGSITTSLSGSEIVTSLPRPGFIDSFREYFYDKEGIPPPTPEYVGTIPTNAEATVVSMAALKMLEDVPIPAPIEISDFRVTDGTTTYPIIMGYAQPHNWINTEFVVRYMGNKIKVLKFKVIHYPIPPFDHYKQFDVEITRQFNPGEDIYPFTGDDALSRMVDTYWMDGQTYDTILEVYDLSVGGSIDNPIMTKSIMAENDVSGSFIIPKFYGNIQGHVKKPDGSHYQQCWVFWKNNDTGVEVSGLTNDFGDYIIHDAFVGSYSYVRVENTAGIPIFESTEYSFNVPSGYGLTGNAPEIQTEI